LLALGRESATQRLVRLGYNRVSVRRQEELDGKIEQRPQQLAQRGGGQPLGEP
jgi:hypothetical protein